MSSRPTRSGSRSRSLRGTAVVRLRVAFVLIAMVFSVFAMRLFQLQGLDPQSYAARAEQAGLVTVTMPAQRGAILDRNGTPLAESVDGLMIVADPTMTRPDAGAIATLLSRRLGLDYFDILERLRRTDTHFQYIARRVPSTIANRVVAALDARGYEGIDTRRDPVRDYPADDVGANLVGMMDAEGRASGGMELTFDKRLSGSDGSETYEVGDGNRIPLGENSVTEPVNGHDITLTIDRDVQWYAQRVLRQAVEAADARSGSVVVLDTHSGETLALADYPTFDANDAGDARLGNLGSRALSDVYEPGSVEKVLTASSLIDAGKVTPHTRFRVPGQLQVADRTIGDWFDHGRLRLTMTGIIAKSSNIGTVLAADQFDDHEMWDYLRAFGLGSATDVGVRGESAGLLPFWKDWSEITHDTIAYGQGVSVNALQMAAAVNTVANGGVRVDPSLVRGSARTEWGDLVGTDTATTHRVISKKAATQTTHMMEMVTDAEEGTASSAAIPGYRVAGKTGTANRVNKNGVYGQRNTVSFAGFAPADKPRFTVYVVIQAPYEGAGGGLTAGPVFQQVMSYLLHRYAVPPTGAPPAHLPTEW